MIQNTNKLAKIIITKVSLYGIPIKTHIIRTNRTLIIDLTQNEFSIIIIYYTYNKILSKLVFSHLIP